MPRLLYIREAFKRGWTVEKVSELSGIDKWFLRHMHELAFFEEEIKAAKTIEQLAEDKNFFQQIKEFGYSDKQIAYLLGTNEIQVRKTRKSAGIIPVYNLVDTCAGEFDAYTPYYYSTYGTENESIPTDRKKL